MTSDPAEPSGPVPRDQDPPLPDTETASPDSLDKPQSTHKSIKEDVKTIASIVQSIFTILAIVAGLWWFVFRGETHPRLGIDHETTFVKLADQGWLTTLEVHIENKGNTELAVEQLEVRVQQVLPLGPIIQERLEAGYHIAVKGEEHVDWPLIESTTHNPHLLIRPGESHVISIELMLPPETDVVKLSSFVPETGRTVGWNHSTLERLE